LRSDRCIASHGLEARTPFLDRGFVQTYLSIPAEIRDHAAQQKCEKYLLRETFADMNIIPNEVLWRTKEAFSDGVSSQKKSWFETIQDFAQIQYPTLSKKNAETKYYDSIYKQFYGSFNSVPYKWMPKFVDADDASARTLKIYGKNNKKNNVKYEPKNLKI
jgi:asparagine synthase (glutamine-hydrolysing)